MKIMVQIVMVVAIKMCIIALASIAQSLEHWPMHQRVTGSIPGQGHLNMEVPTL